MKMITTHAKIKQREQKTNAEKIKKHQNTKTHKTRRCFLRRPDKKTQKHMGALSEEQIKTQKHIKHKQGRLK